MVIIIGVGLINAICDSCYKNSDYTGIAVRALSLSDCRFLTSGGPQLEWKVPALTADKPWVPSVFGEFDVLALLSNNWLGDVQAKTYARSYGYRCPE